MSEKTAAENSLLKKERFEFIFTANGKIICQRYFHINRFKEVSLGSNELRSAVYECVNLIKKDLKAKSNIYTRYKECQHFNNEAQMRKWEANPTFRLDAFSYIVLDDTGETFLWDGTKIEAYGKPIANTEDDTPCILKFAFCDYGEEIVSYSWDGRDYPKFVRTNIDLSNSKNRYANDDVNHSSSDRFYIDQFIAARPNIIPQIIRKLCYICSSLDTNDYTYNLVINKDKLENGKPVSIETNYGYPSSAMRTYWDPIKRLEKKYRKRTDSYYGKA